MTTEIKLISDGFPLEINLPLHSSTSEAIEIFISRFEKSKNIRINSESSRADKVIHLEIDNQEGVDEMVKIIETPLSE